MTAYGVALERLVLPVGDRLVGQEMCARLRRLRALDLAPPDRRRPAIDAAFDRLVAAAWETPFHAERLRQAGFGPDEPLPIERLAALPLMSRVDLIETSSERLRRPTGQAVIEKRSSGSTGEPVSVAADSFTEGVSRARTMWLFEQVGWRIGDPHVQFGIMPERGLVRGVKDALLRVTYSSAYDLDDVALDRVIGRLVSGVRFVFGYPQALAALARRALARGVEVRVDGIVSWGDALWGDDVLSLVRAFPDAAVVDAYGSTEAHWIAARLRPGCDYHLFDLDCVAELVDGDGRVVTGPGVEGEVVVTRLHPGPTPLLRYRTGDRAVLGPSGACGRCGRTGSTWQRLSGRVPDLIVTPSGNRLVVHFFTGVFDEFTSVRVFQVRHAQGRLRVLVVPAGGWSADEADRLAARLHERGCDLPIDVETAVDIPLTPAGKRRFVVVE